MKLLIIEDEIQISKPLKIALQKRNFAVDLALDGQIGFNKALVNNYDCIILDLNLPKLDGLEVAQKLRQNQIKTPILMLTARSLQENVYQGFESGTDDYLTKPFDFKELLYRINALIKRNSNINLGENILQISDIKLNTKTLQVFKSEKLIQLNAKEYGILEYLIQNKNKVISQEQLLEHVWNENVDMFTQTVRTNIKTLRKKVDPDKKLIKTFKGKGYKISEK